MNAAKTLFTFGKQYIGESQQDPEEKIESETEMRNTLSQSRVMTGNEIKVGLLQIARDIDDEGCVSQDSLRRLEWIAQHATSVQLKVSATRAKVSLRRTGASLPATMEGWNPWEFSFQQSWRMDHTDADEILEMHLRKERLPEWIGILDVLGDLDLSERNISVIPDSIGELVLSGHLILTGNRIVALPTAFPLITVDGDVRLDNNAIERLPHSFGHLRVGGDLRLNHNHICELPDDFGYVTVGGNLQLSHNALVELPPSFGRLEVEGNVTLNRNSLQAIPTQMGNIRVGGDLRLDRNSLTDMPGECQDMRVYGYVWLGGNQLNVAPGADAFPRLIMENGPINRCRRNAYRFMTDFVLSTNCLGLILLYVSSGQEGAPFTGWRLAFFAREPNITAYMMIIALTMGIFNATTRGIETFYSVKPSNWRQYLIYPLVWSHILIGFDLLTLYDSETIDVLIVHYTSTLIVCLVYSLVTACVYVWVFGDTFDMRTRRFR